MFDPFLSPHPWISVSARMVKCSTRQAPLSSACSDLRAQLLALPNVWKHKICTGLQSSSVLAFTLEVKPHYFLSVLQKKSTITVSSVLTCYDLLWPAQLSLLSPTWPKSISRVGGCQQELTFAGPTQLRSQGCIIADNWQFLFANWRLTSLFLSAPLTGTPEQKDNEIQVPVQWETFLCVQKALDQASNQSVIIWKDIAIVILVET